MAIEFVGAIENTESETVPRPGPAYAVGDVFILSQACANNQNLRTPTGFIPVWTQDLAFNRRCQLSYKWGTESEPSSYYVYDFPTAKATILSRYSGVSSFGGFDVQDRSSSSSCTAPLVSPDTEGSLLVWQGNGHPSSGSPPGAVPGYSNGLWSGRSSGNGYGQLQYEQIVSPGVAPAATSSGGWANQSYFTHRGTHLWFRPIPTAPSGPPSYRQILARRKRRWAFRWER